MTLTYSRHPDTYSRHPELVSGPIEQHSRSVPKESQLWAWVLSDSAAQAAKWTLKRVQGDKVGLEALLDGVAVP